MTETATALASGSSAELLAFRIGDQSFGLPINSVREVIGRSQLHPLPSISAVISGAIALRGRFLPVVSGRRRLGMGEDVAAPTVLEVECNGTSFGLAVDGVSGVITSDGMDRHEMGLRSDYGGCAAGVLARTDGLLVVLSPEALAAREA